MAAIIPDVLPLLIGQDLLVRYSDAATLPPFYEGYVAKLVDSSLGGISRIADLDTLTADPCDLDGMFFNSTNDTAARIEYFRIYSGRIDRFDASSGKLFYRADASLGVIGSIGDSSSIFEVGRREYLFCYYNARNGKCSVLNVNNDLCNVSSYLLPFLKTFVPITHVECSSSPVGVIYNKVFLDKLDIPEDFVKGIQGVVLKEIKREKSSNSYILSGTVYYANPNARGFSFVKGAFSKFDNLFLEHGTNFFVDGDYLKSCGVDLGQDNDYSYGSLVISRGTNLDWKLIGLAGGIALGVLSAIWIAYNIVPGYSAVMAPSVDAGADLIKSSADKDNSGPKYKKKISKPKKHKAKKKSSK
ncbi:hypothetical protein J4230_00490 [Candidatus Woesearchaeota archaeon]|nr:hypothetical protein [Candidatus Woesearchaeota archaeon]